MIVALATGAILGFSALGLSAPSVATAHASHANDSPSLTIVRPTSGPIGANVLVKLQSAPPGHHYTLGYALGSSSCSSGSTAITGAPTLVSGNDGIARGYFIWPSDANQVQSSYFVCAQDQADSSFVQSGNQFEVLANAAPTISITAVQSPTVTPGGTPPASPGATPIPTGSPPPGGAYTADQQVLIQGQNFAPIGTKLGIFIDGTTTLRPSSTRLTIEGAPDNTVKSDAQGSFNAIVTLPDNPLGLRYLHAATLDGTTNFPPTLDSYQEIYVSPIATPTPTVAPTVVPTMAQTPTPPSTGSSSGWSVGRTLGVAGLGGLSIVLLMAGVILLVSTEDSAQPRREE